jgi:hypothetical protein
MFLVYFGLIFCLKERELREAGSVKGEREEKKRDILRGEKE